MEGLDTGLMPALSGALIYSHTVFEERWTNSISFMVKNQLTHQESGIAKLQKLTSNTSHILPKTVLWFKLSWVDLIIMEFIMVMLKFTLHSYHLNIYLNLLHIQTPTQFNQLMMMECTISCSSSTNNMMIIFWMLTSIWFRLD